MKFTRHPRCRLRRAPTGEHSGAGKSWNWLAAQSRHRQSAGPPLNPQRSSIDRCALWPPPGQAQRLPRCRLPTSSIIPGHARVVCRVLRVLARDSPATSACRCPCRPGRSRRSCTLTGPAPENKEELGSRPMQRRKETSANIQQQPTQRSQRTSSRLKHRSFKIAIGCGWVTMEIEDVDLPFDEQALQLFGPVAHSVGYSLSEMGTASSHATVLSGRRRVFRFSSQRNGGTKRKWRIVGDASYMASASGKIAPGRGPTSC